MSRLVGPPARVLIVGLPLAWLAHLALGYTVSSVHCHDGWFSGELAGVPLVRIVLALLTLALVVYVAVTLVLLWRDRTPHEGAKEEPYFRAFVGTLLCANVGAYLIWSVVPIFIAEVCG